MLGRAWRFYIVVAVLAPAPVWAGMSLSLEAKQDTFVMGEPIHVTLTATNDTSEPIETALVLRPDAGMVLFYVSEGGGEFKRYIGPGWGTRDVYLLPSPVAPGASFSTDFELLWHNALPGAPQDLARNLAFPEPRCYELKVRSLLPHFDTESNIIEFCTTTPTGQDLAVWESIVEEPELARFIQRPTALVSETVRKRAETLLEQNQSSKNATRLEQALRVRREFDAQTAAQGN